MYFEALLVVGLAVIVAWVVRRFAPPSLLRDGELLPVAMSGRHTGAGVHHGGGGELVPPSPVSTEPLASFAGTLFLACHVVAVLLILVFVPVRRVVARRDGWASWLVFAGGSGVAVGAAAAVTAAVIYRDAVEGGELLSGALEAGRYGFVAVFAIAAVFGVPGSVAGTSGRNLGGAG